MKIKYIERRFSPKSQAKIDQANKIIDEYLAQGFTLTLRQLYYQFVSRDLIPNTMREYKNLGSVIVDARLAGLISWQAIVDRTRGLVANTHWDDAHEIVESCANDFQMDLWANQPRRVEVWIEKDALIGVIENICRELDVAYFSCRGYPSASEIWQASQRLRRYEKRGQDTLILHLGDHDPSGMDMTRDITDRLHLFGAGTTIDRIALNMDQIEKYNPPPNPVKLSDSRGDKYVDEYGTESWELDALEPKVLADLIEESVINERDGALYREALDEQSAEAEKIQNVLGELD